MVVALQKVHELAATGARLARPLAPEALFLEAVQAARTLTGATYASLGLVEGNVIHWQTAAGKPLADVKGYRQPLAEGLCGWVVRHGRARRSGDVTQEPDHLCQYAEMLSELDVPIKAGETVVGVLSVESVAREAFSAVDEALLQILAGYVAVALVYGRPGL